YVALLLLAIGETRASVAGLLIATFAVGGVFYSLSVPALISRVREQHLMVAGGTLAATGLVLIALFFPWMWQIAIYALFGCLDSASTSCTVVSRSMSPNSPRRHAALPRRCIILLLPWPSGGPGGLWLWFCPRRARAKHFRRRSGRDDSWSCLLAT